MGIRKILGWILACIGVVGFLASLASLTSVEAVIFTTVGTTVIAAYVLLVIGLINGDE
jgi:hypothetical protein